MQAGSRDKLRELLAVASGGVVFTTIQKFLPDRSGDWQSSPDASIANRSYKGKMPELSPRRNIIVIADEAHRSQYDLIDGLARHMCDALPNASGIGLTPSLPLLGRASACAWHSLSEPPCSFGSPDLQEKAVKTVLAQAELLCAEWV